MARHQFIDVTAYKYIVFSPLLCPDGTYIYEQIYYCTNNVDDAIEKAKECSGEIRNYENETDYNCVAY